MNDDVLAEMLRAEVPAPKPGYWTAIDDRIAAAARELSTEQMVEADTGADVVRLMDMTNPHQMSTSIARTRWLLAAAAAVVLLFVAGAVLVGEDTREPTEVDPVDRPDPAPDGTPAAIDPDDDEVTDVSPGPSEAWDGTLTDIGPSAAWIPRGDAEVAVQLLPGPGQDVAAITVRPEVLFGTGDGATVDGVDWIEVLWGPFQTVGVFVRADQVQVVGGLMEPVAPTTISFVTDGIEVRDWPALDAPVRFLGAPEVLITRTGIAVDVDGEQWVQLLDGFERPFTWVPAALTVDVAGDANVDVRRNCYADATNVLVLDFSDDAETFTGGFAFLDSVETVSGARVLVAGTHFDVLTSALGSAEDGGEPTLVQERWQATADGLSVGARAFLEPVACADVADEVERLIDLLRLDR